MLGIDPSLTGTGICVLNGPEVVALYTVKTGKLRGHERMSLILNAVNNYSSLGIDLVVIEGPSYGSAAGQSGHHERAGLWWLITRALFVRKIPYAVVAPAARALYATGLGRAGKPEVLLCMRARFSYADIGDDNQADALALAAMGAEHLGVDLPTGPERSSLAMRKVDWPELVSDAQ